MKTKAQPHRLGVELVEQHANQCLSSDCATWTRARQCEGCRTHQVAVLSFRSSPSIEDMGWLRRHAENSSEGYRLYRMWRKPSAKVTPSMSV